MFMSSACAAFNCHSASSPSRWSSGFDISSRIDDGWTGRRFDNAGLERGDADKRRRRRAGGDLGRRELFVEASADIGVGREDAWIAGDEIIEGRIPRERCILDARCGGQRQGFLDKAGGEVLEA